MGKAKKEPTQDPAVKDKLDQILAEITTAQSQGVPPREVLKKAASYLEEEPYLTIHLIEALIRIPNQETAQLLTAMMAESEEKQIIFDWLRKKTLNTAEVPCWKISSLYTRRYLRTILIHLILLSNFLVKHFVFHS